MDYVTIPDNAGEEILAEERAKQKLVEPRVFVFVVFRDILDTLNAANDLYFDVVSQIRMHGWSRDRTVLVGDACFCPSLLAGQGAAFAMAGAYILAGELRQSDGATESPSEHTKRFSASLSQGSNVRQSTLVDGSPPRPNSGSSHATK